MLRPERCLFVRKVFFGDHYVKDNTGLTNTTHKTHDTIQDRISIVNGFFQNASYRAVLRHRAIVEVTRRVFPSLPRRVSMGQFRRKDMKK